MGIRPPARRRGRAAEVVLAVFFLVAAGLGVAAATDKLQSAWRDRDVKIDGVNDEWQNRLVSVKNGSVSVGVMNDNRYLYVTVLSSAPERRASLMAGLTVWLDATGKKKHTFGVLVPGLRGEFGGRGGRGGYPGLPGGDRGGQADPGVISDEMSRPLDYVEILGPGKDDRRRVELGPDSGIQAARGFREGVLDYEIRVPLAPPDAPSGATESTTDALHSAPGGTIGLGLETPKREEAAGRSGGFGGIGGRGGFGGIGGRGGMGGRGGTGGMRGGSFQMPQSLSIWATTTLAAAR